MDTYSTYEAKTRFSEIIRKVRAGRRVVVTHHGTRVAEIRPVEPVAAGIEARLTSLERDGTLVRQSTAGDVPLLARRRGALKRFLASRD